MFVQGYHAASNATVQVGVQAMLVYGLVSLFTFALDIPKRAQLAF